MAIVICLLAVSSVRALKVGDIVAVDPHRDQLLAVDSISGNQTVLSSGGYFDNPNEVVLDGLGHAYVTEFLRDLLIRVDLATGAQTIVSENLYNVTGIAWDPSGKLLVTADDIGQGSLIRVDPLTGAQQIIASGLAFPRGLEASDHDTAYVTRGGSILEIDLAAGSVSIVSSNNLLHAAWDVAAGTDARLYVANLLGPGVVAVDPLSGAQSDIASGPAFFLNPMSICASLDGSLLVANAGSDAAPGGIVRVDPLTGNTQFITQTGNFTGIAVLVPEPALARLGLYMCALARRRRRQS